MLFNESVARQDMLKCLNESEENDKKCPKCGSQMKLKKGRFGYFWGCSKYPSCGGIKHIASTGRYGAPIKTDKNTIKEAAHNIPEETKKLMNESKSRQVFSWHDMLKKMEELGYDYTGDYSFVPEGYKRKQMLYRFDYNSKPGTKKLNIQEIKDQFDGNVTVFRGSSRYAPEQSFVLITNKIFDSKINESLIIKESDEELPEETKKFVDDIKQVFNKKFPNSRCIVSFSDNLGPSITIWFYLAKNEKEVSNGIMMNDACRHIFLTSDLNDDGTLKDNISFERIAGRGVTRKIHEDDPNEKYLAYSYIKVPYRKVTGNKETVIRNFERYVDKLAQVILDNADDINGGIVGNLFDVRDKISK